MDSNDKQLDPPMEIQVLVEDLNDNAPVCANMESVFEVQEDEPVGKMCVCVRVCVCMCLSACVCVCVCLSVCA